MNETWKQHASVPGRSQSRAPGFFSALSQAGDLIKGANSLSWALALLAVQQVPAALVRPCLAIRGVPGQGLLDQVQTAIAALTCDIFTLDASPPHFATGAVLQLMLASDRLIKTMAEDGERPHAWQEFQNKLQVFYLFEHVDTVLGAVSDSLLSLSELVRKVAGLGTYHAVWATEGLGHQFTNRNLCSLVLPRGLLRHSATYLPKSSMLPLHAGMGLSLARFLLPRASNCQNLVDRFVESCRSNSHEEYLGVAYESLGFACRSLFPQFVGPIHRYLSHESHPLLPFFWHGIGRAIYFSPFNFFPFPRNRWSGMRTCRDESPSEFTRCSALAGYFWAMNLVNIRHPDVICLWLENHAREMPQPSAFINGIYSSVIAWCDAAPDDTSLDTLAGFHPNSSSSAELWDTYVSQPLAKARADHQKLSNTQGIGTVFSVQIP